MAVLADVSFALAEVQAPALTGRIDRVLYWYPGMAAAVELTGAVSVPFGTPLTLYVVWTNTSPVPITGHVDLTVTRPDGTTLAPAAVSGQDVLAAPNNGAIPQFEAVTLNQPGSWRGRTTLSA